MSIGRPLGATAFLLMRMTWVFHKCATRCSSSYMERKYIMANIVTYRHRLFDSCTKAYWLQYCVIVVETNNSLNELLLALH